MKVQRQIPVTAYRAAGFMDRYQRLIRSVVIPYQHDILWDRIPGVEKSHAAANFISAGRVLRGEDPGDGFYGMVFQDSDAAKWLEAAAYALAADRSPELEKDADELIGLIAAAQDSDGYLNTYYTVKDQDRRWTDLLEGHELYCSGHMIEAACAYYEATGKRTLLDVMIRNAEHIFRRFVEQDVPGCPGHPEVELALMKLYRLTGDSRFLDLCRRFIDQRGADPDFFRREAENRGWSVWGSDGRDTDYLQAGKPVREQSDATGHAVRAVYLYTAMADLASETEDRDLLAACRRLWRSIVSRRMYVTGGIGSTVHGEAFTVDYDLPPDTAYAETCASIGLIFFASRMLENEVSAEYADVMETALYNTVLAGMQLDGKRFFYVNPLQADPGISGVVKTHAHDLPVRPAWYACACCPPNVARLLGSIGKYAYGESADTAFCHLFAAGTVRFGNGLSLLCETDYPYGMDIRYHVSGRGTLAVRVPRWSAKTLIHFGGRSFAPSDLDCPAPGAEPACPFLRGGYVFFPVDGEADIRLILDGTPAFIRPSSRIPRLAGMTALRRGPLVYCFEGRDNGSVKALRIDSSVRPELAGAPEDLPEAAVTLKVAARRVLDDGDQLYSEAPERSEPCQASAIPYYTWANRGENEMRVWMP